MTDDMTNYAKRDHILKTLEAAARQIHDGHDHFDAVKISPTTPNIRFSQCTRQLCSDLREAIEIVENTRPSGFRPTGSWGKDRKAQ